MESAPFTRIGVSLARGTTAEEVAGVLREMIMSGRLAPDTPMRETSLSAEFEVSRRTLRDALGVLEHEGLVRHHRHKGSRVTQFEADDIRDLYRARRAMEVAAARAVRQAPQSAKDALRKAIDRLGEAIQAGSAPEVVARDLEFHQAVVGLLRSDRLDRFFGTIAVEMRYALSILEATYHETSQRPEAAFAEHREIYEALIQSDEALAIELIEKHIDDNEDLLLRVVINPDQDLRSTSMD